MLVDSVSAFENTPCVQNAANLVKSKSGIFNSVPIKVHTACFRLMNTGEPNCILEYIYSEYVCMF